MKVIVPHFQIAKNLPYFKLNKLTFGIIFVSAFTVLATLLYIWQINDKANNDKKSLAKETQEKIRLTTTLNQVNKNYETLKNQDQIKRNDDLQKEIREIQAAYTSTLQSYEELSDIPATVKELPQFKKDFAQILQYLSDKNYSSATAKLSSLKSGIDKYKSSLSPIPTGINLASVPVNNTPPGSGHSRQQVDVNGQKFVVDLVAGNMSTTRIIVDTATDGDCRDNCPVLSLGDYVARNGAYAGINGSYFCPADYPSCAGKTNSFDTLAMNKNKKYLNSDNNVYSTVPAVIFLNGSMRFVGQSLEWGRDTGADGVLANHPLLVSGGNVVFGGDGDPKKGSVGNRSFVANKGGIAYIGVVRSATVAQSALVLKALGMDNALNLDSGGSTALWAGGGYKAGPGRGIPNAILFVNK